MTCVGTFDDDAMCNEENVFEGGEWRVEGGGWMEGGGSQQCLYCAKKVAISRFDAFIGHHANGDQGKVYPNQV